ncbi:uncharacterized protein E5676_scaffold84664G00740 [Cucumis melo var. makuwa]|uniref:Uncharacterized protein n=1 Tax=Cucumis melo var. makuwa TaxID=1194695 RepID=A0A5A7T4F8_CUCMM|nr:uncharacterized protein E6C27_scaffold270G00980 [Cucumis melo var. makuwa]TYK30649.1 uncharacterized protein E5676_scaffold84664G00740 [Cucumis melo var. makuwa]
MENEQHLIAQFVGGLRFDIKEKSTKEQEKDKTSDPNGKKPKVIPKKQVEIVYQRPNLSKCVRCGQLGDLSSLAP